MRGKEGQCMHGDKKRRTSDDVVFFFSFSFLIGKTDLPCPQLLADEPCVCADLRDLSCSAGSV